VIKVRTANCSIVLVVDCSIWRNSTSPRLLGAAGRGRASSQRPWNHVARIWDGYLYTLLPDGLLLEACKRLAGVSKLTRDEMRLAGYSDDIPEIDVCQ
jgi:hypothetical protein